MSFIDKLLSLASGGGGSPLGGAPGTTPLGGMVMQPNADGSLSFVTAQGPDQGAHLDGEFYDNLAEGVDEAVLSRIAIKIKDDFGIDYDALDQRRRDTERALQLLGFNYEETSDPFEGACNVVHTLLAEHVVRYQSKAIVEIFPSNGPVRTKIVGSAPPPVQDQAMRVQEFMNYELTTQIPEFFDEQERLLFGVGLMGTGFKKNWFDPAQGRISSAYVPEDRLIVPVDAASLETAARFHEVLPVSIPDMARRISTGYYLDPNLLQPGGASEVDKVEEEIHRQQGMRADATDTTTWKLIESFYYLDPEDIKDTKNMDSEVLLPYIVTWDRDTGKILAIRRNWREADKDRRIRIWHTPYYFIKGPGFYGYGLYHLIGGYADVVTSSQRQLVDAGTFANLQGGFKLRGLRVAGDVDEPVAPGEFRDVDSTSADLTKSIVPFTYKEPSATMLSLMERMIDDASKFADSTDQIVGNSSTYGPVGTIVAMLEQSSRMQNALHKRLHRSQGIELQQIKELNYEVLPASYPYNVDGVPRTIFKKDFDGSVGVVPASDPNIFSQSQRLAIAQAKQSLLQQMSAVPGQLPPWMRSAYREVLLGLGEQNPDAFLPPLPQQGPPPLPMDPVSEQVALLQSKPVQAFPNQDHQAHVQALIAFINDPAYGMAMEQIGPAVQALLFSHMAMMRMQEVVAVTGQPMPPPGAQVPPPVQAQIDQHAAQVIQQLAQNRPPSLAMPGGQDPKIALQQQQIDLGRDQLAQKEQHDAATIAYKYAHSLAQSTLGAERLTLQGRVQAVNQDIKRAAIEQKGGSVEE